MILAEIVPGSGFWCRTKPGGRAEWSYGMNFGRTLHDDCRGYVGPVPIEVDNNPRRAVQGDQPFTGPDGLSGWIRPDCYRARTTAQAVQP